MRIFLFFGQFLLPGLLFAQPDFAPMVDAAKRGDATGLSAFMDTYVEMTILNEDNRLAKAGATTALASFFGQNRPSNCTIVNKGMSDDKVSHFCVCNLTTSGGNYRLFFYLRQNAGKYLIKELRIER